MLMGDFLDTNKIFQIWSTLEVSKTIDSMGMVNKLVKRQVLDIATWGTIAKVSRRKANSHGRPQMASICTLDPSKIISFKAGVSIPPFRNIA
jgi:nucleoid DNA-binding protein